MMGSICSTDTTTDAASAPTTPARTIKPFVMSWESYMREQALGRPEPTLTSIASLEKMPESSDDVIRDLEARQLPVIKEALQSTNPSDILTSFMKNGTDEFKERTGRNMTYAEMRAAWG
jgi:hypothetical protein